MWNSECAPYVKLHIGFRERHCKEKEVCEAVVAVGSCCGGLPCSRLSQLPAVSGKQVLTKTSGRGEGREEDGRENIHMLLLKFHCCDFSVLFLFSVWS